MPLYNFLQKDECVFPYAAQCSSPLPILRDRVGSIVRPVKELKDFAKVKLETGASTVIKFSIDKEKLSLHNQQLQWVAEPGIFDVMIGASSSDIRLQDSFELSK